jgi:ABC-type phosphate/phosphonate transport system substrate-binding protein
MIANARMYSVSAEAAEAWRQLFLGVAAQANVPLEVIEHPAPAPLTELWDRTDKAAVFMCGLPYSLSMPRPSLIAAPVPAPATYGDRAVYWSEFIVRSQSRFTRVEDVFGQRLALTTTDSQSGFAAPLRYLSLLEERSSYFSELVAPQQTPLGAVRAVVEGLADTAPVDSYALELLGLYRPELVAQIRVLARTESRPIPPLTGSVASEALTSAFLSAHLHPGTAAAMAKLQLRRFERPAESDYNTLAAEFQTTLKYWHTHRLANRVHPAFAAVLSAPKSQSSV